MVGHHEHGLMAQSQALALHRGGNHLKGLARAHLMGQEGIAAIEDVGNGVDLVRLQLDLRVDAVKLYPASIVFTGPDAVHFLIVLLHQGLPPLGVPPYPVLKLIPEGLLLLRRQGGLFGVQNPLFLAVQVLHGVINANIPEVQRILQDAVGAGAAGAVGGVSGNIFAVNAVFRADEPLFCRLRMVDHNLAAQVIGRFQRLVHKLLDVELVDPVRPQPDLDLGSVQVLGLGGGQSIHIGLGAVLLFRRQRGMKRLSHAEFLAHVAGEVLVRRDQRKPVHIQKGFGDMVRVLIASDVPEDHAGQLLLQLGLRFSGELGHEGHIHLGPLPDRYCQGIHRRVHAGDMDILLDGPLGEHIRFPFQLAIIVQHLQGAEQIVGGIPVKGQPVGPVVDEAKFLGKSVIEPVQLRLFPLNSIV